MIRWQKEKVEGIMVDEKEMNKMKRKMGIDNNGEEKKEVEEKGKKKNQKERKREGRTRKLKNGVRKRERREGKVWRRVARNAKEWGTKEKKPKIGKCRVIQQKIKESTGTDKNREE